MTEERNLDAFRIIMYVDVRLNFKFHPFPM